MRKFLITAIAILLCGFVFAQVYLPVVPTSYGRKENRIKALLVNHLPEKNGLQTNTADTSAQIFYNLEDQKVWGWSNQRGYFLIGEGGSISGDTIYVKGVATNLLMADTIREDAYEIIVFPDLQNMTRYREAYSRSMFQWLADSSTYYNVKALLQVGDITDWNTVEEWDTLAAQLSVFTTAQPNIPYLFVPGNHDYGNGFSPSGRDATNYNNYLGVAHFTGKPWYMGSYGATNENYWIKFDVGSRKYAVVGLEFLPRDAVLAWANNITDSLWQADPTREVMVVNHAHISQQGELASDTAVYSSDYYGMTADNSGQEVWDNYLKLHSNIRWVFSGHFLIPNTWAQRGLTDRITASGINGNLIHQIFVNYQDDHNWGDGYFMRMKFYPDSSDVGIRFWSSYYLNDDTTNLGYTLDNPTIDVKTSMAIKGDVGVNGNFRVEGEAKFVELHKGSVPFIDSDHRIFTDTSFKYSPVNDSLTVGTRMTIRQRIKYDNPVSIYVQDSVGYNVAEFRFPRRDNVGGQHGIGIGVGALKKWKATTAFYSETNTIAIGYNALSSDTGRSFKTTVIGSWGAWQGTAIRFSTILGGSAAYNMLTGEDNVLNGSNAAATATDIWRSVLIGGDVAYSSTGSIIDATIIGSGAARQATEADSSVIIGSRTARDIVNVRRSVIIGREVGRYHGTDLDDRLLIDNSGVVPALIDGDFAGDSVKINGKFIATNKIRLPSDSAASGKVLTALDDQGNADWRTATGGGGATNPAGNYGNLQINRNGVFDTPGSDSLSYTTADGLRVKNIIKADSSLIADDIQTGLYVNLGNVGWYLQIKGDGSNKAVYNNLVGGVHYFSQGGYFPSLTIDAGGLSLNNNGPIISNSGHINLSPANSGYSVRANAIDGSTVALKTLSPTGTTANLQEWQVNGVNVAYITAGGGLVSPSVTTATTQLHLSQTGDVFGESGVKIQNRTGANGAVFYNSGLDLVDLGFLSNAPAQFNFRYEHRAGQVLSGNSDGEFQLLKSDGTFFAKFGIGANELGAGIVINETGVDSDTRIESDTHTDAFFLDGSNGAVSIGAYGAGSITGTATYALSVDATGKIIETAIPTLTDNEYTPTPSNTTNVDASTAYVTQYYRVGDRVTVFGEIDIDATATGAVEVRIDLPIATAFTQTYHLAGNATCSSSGVPAAISGYVTGGTAAIKFIATTTTNDKYSFQFSYKYIAP